MSVNRDIDLDKLPPVAVDPKELPPVLPYGLQWNVLMPTRDVSLTDAQYPIRDEAVPWTLQLELCYLQFHPTTWEILKADDQIDERYYDALLDLCARLGDSVYEGDRHVRLREAIVRVLIRRLTRWGRLYVLHRAREKYFRQQFALHPTWSVSDVVISIPLSEEYPPVQPKAPISSLWPLPIPHPDAAVQRQLIQVTIRNHEPYRLFDVKSVASEATYERLWGTNTKKSDRRSLTAFQDLTITESSVAVPAADPFPVASVASSATATRSRRHRDRSDD